MYIQITTRCNMTCEHCCYSCTEKGEDMALDIFKACLSNADEHISLGGGEPTIHPKFWEFMGLALGSEAEYVWLATNGSITDTALSLARLAKKGVIGCELSTDSYHDAIDDAVTEAFTKDKQRGEYISGFNDNDNRGLRDITNGGRREPIEAGRCDWGESGCVCPDLIVRPNGDIYACGCDDAPKFGNIISGYKIPEDWEISECHKEQERTT